MKPYIHQTSSNQGIWKTTLLPSNKFHKRSLEKSIFHRTISIKVFEKPYIHQTSSIKVFPKTLLPPNKFSQGISKNPPSIKQVQFKVFQKTLLPSNKCHQDL
jgi:hypothetical protein